MDNYFNVKINNLDTFSYHYFNFSVLYYISTVTDFANLKYTNKGISHTSNFTRNKQVTSKLISKHIFKRNIKKKNTTFL